MIVTEDNDEVAVDVLEYTCNSTRIGSLALGMMALKTFCSRDNV